MRNRFLPFLLCLVFLASSPAANAKNLIDSLAGVYKKRFENSLVDESKFTSEDILEIVALDAESAYIVIHLEFFNAHICELTGLFKLEGENSLVYTDKDEEQKCTLKITREKGELVFKSPGNVCNEYCGARGSLNDATFPLKSRKKITYMHLILKSDEYREAVKPR